MGKLRSYAVVRGVLAAILLAARALSDVESPKLILETGAAPGEFSIVNGPLALSLNSAVAVQQLVNGKWVPVSVTNLYLRDGCSSARPAHCRSVAPGQTIKVLRWTGNFCSSQCPGPCRMDGPVPAGTYRFAITTCDGKETFTSADFRKLK